MTRNGENEEGSYRAISITSFLIRMSENVDEELTAGDRFFKEKFNDWRFLRKVESWRLPRMTV